ncbi:uncharacterized protein EMH_0097660 [Eimeria mitis]|uniref:Uncharacterized protein n=1 Tax=Eimeria mitis TaxID=44415 RepID=U6KC00_9EIME|nr:uncharacterized protein EMH_0097660 [Eimeria mitis]CDJ35459.1 hypothetical protein, conserved [Eimeria mitis]
MIRLHSYLRLQIRPQQRAPSLAEWQRQQQQRSAQRKSPHKPTSPLSPAENEDPMSAAPELPSTQLEMGGHDEYDRVNKLADEVEQQLIDSPQEESENMSASSSGSGADYTPRLNSAYPSSAIPKPRNFYNYFGDDTVSLLETNPDEILYKFAGGSASTDTELFVPLQLDSQSAAASAASSLNLQP